MVFTVEDRDRVRERLLELAHADPRVSAAAVVGAEARGEADRWSDVDLTFGLIDGASVGDTLEDWTRALATELDAVDLCDVQVGRSIASLFSPAISKLTFHSTRSSRFWIAVTGAVGLSNRRRRDMLWMEPSRKLF